VKVSQSLMKAMVRQLRQHWTVELKVEFSAAEWLVASARFGSSRLYLLREDFVEG